MGDVTELKHRGRARDKTDLAIEALRKDPRSTAVVMIRLPNGHVDVCVLGEGPDEDLLVLQRTMDALVDDVWSMEAAE
jgi:hypothetical protein